MSNQSAGSERPQRSGMFSFVNNSSIRTKILLSTIVGALTSILIAGFGLVSLLNAQRATEELKFGVTEIIDSFIDVQTHVWQARVYVAYGNEGNGNQYNKEIKAKAEKEFALVEEDLDRYLKSYDNPLNDELVSHIEEYKSLAFDSYFPKLLNGQGDIAQQVRDTQITLRGTALFDTVEEINDIINEEAVRLAEVTEKTEKQAIITMAIIAALGIILTIAIAQFTSSRIRRNVASLNTSIDALAEGDLTVAPNVNSGDEIGKMAESLVAAQTSLRTILRDVVGNAHESVKMSEVLSAASSQVSASSAETSAQASVVATAAEQVSGNVQTVAAGAEQMSASIREIAQNAQEATAVAQTAATTADSTNATISRLGDSSKEIGDVIKTITSIAEQTNLLALNATIEAARAGEAGKGFAVVASEVKDLAAESARAAEDVARRVEAIQNDTSSAINAIGQISEIIGTINNYQLTIASAVEEQTATTNEMSRSAAEAATGSSEIAANINSVATIVDESTSAVAEMDKTIEAVSSSADGLRSQVEVFKF
ncbi:methyl-accepting chemotaxis protein [Timonella sp. A28]|uniref:methyl-accepting chemotaxis protein n=1 Tax=Timonella sp. A28 TaxID=3442640 RepID=UPI003EBE406C